MNKLDVRSIAEADHLSTIFVALQDEIKDLWFKLVAEIIDNVVPDLVLLLKSILFVFARLQSRATV